MKQTSRYLILRHLIFAATFLAVGACSFKKDPKKETSIMVVEATQKQTSNEIDYSAIIAQEDEDAAIEKLKSLNLDFRKIKTKEGSLADTAIAFDKTRVLKYLIINSHSPFDLTEKSYSTLSYKTDLFNVISLAQRDRFMNIVGLFPKGSDGSDEAEFESFISEIKKQNLGAHGCENFTDFLIQLNSYQLEHGFPGAYFAQISEVSAPNAIEKLLINSACKENTKFFAQSKIAEWLTSEILNQFQNNFSSIKLTNLILSLGRPQYLSINLTSSRKYSGASQLRIDPIVLFIIKQVCKDQISNYDEWLKLFKQNFTKTGQFYSVRYYMPEDLDASDRTECWPHETFCENNWKNQSTLGKVYGRLFPSSKYVEDSFGSPFIDALNETNEIDARKLKKEICSTSQTPDTFNNEENEEPIEEDKNQESKEENSHKEEVILYSFGKGLSKC